MRACNETDINEMFFPPADENWSRDKLHSIRDDMFCLDDPNQIALVGQLYNDVGSFMIVKWKMCVGKSIDGKECKNPDEIETWMKQVTVHQMHNTQRYAKTTYNDGVIQSNAII